MVLQMQGKDRIFFLIDKQAVVWYTKRTKKNSLIFEMIYPGGLRIWKRSRMKS